MLDGGFCLSVTLVPTALMRLTKTAIILLALPTKAPVVAGKHSSKHGYGYASLHWFQQLQHNSAGVCLHCCT